MPTKRQTIADPVTTAVDSATAAFDKVIEQALRQFHDPLWLADYSPLASPYFLGDALDFPVTQQHTTENMARGQALQQLLLSATDQMAAQARRGDSWRELLHESYFSTHDLPTHQVIHKLHMAEATYHRHRNAAIHALGETLLGIAKPALRLEEVAPPTQLVGRATHFAELSAALSAGTSAGISGPGGVGKSTLGRAVAHQIAPDATFWYTVTPGLNDRGHTLYVALAWFLHGQGASTLWSQLVADRGALNRDVALNLLRHDCAHLQGKAVLLCFDEVDLLHPDESEAHAQFVAILETVRTLLPTLYIGQKIVLESALPVALTGLTITDIQKLTQQAAFAMPTLALSQLHEATQGNPRLIELFLAFAHSLQRQGEAADAAIATALTHFTQEPSLEFLLRRIWQHLNESEMYLLELLAVFRNPIPRAAWNDQAQQDAIDQLAAWHLVQADGAGYIQLLPAFRDAIYKQLLTADEKELLHLEAALVRAQYGQFAAAAHHYVAGGEATAAINLLHTYQTAVIDQGQAAVALVTLQQISTRQLAEPVRETLAILQAELQKLLGHYDEAQTTLASIRWRIPFLTAQRWRLEGDIAELRGEVTRAQTAYQQGLATIDQLLNASALFHRDLGYLYANDVDFDKAEAEVTQLRHEAANLEGFIAEMRGDLSTAATAYATALQLAQSIDYFYGEANAQNNLGRIYGWQRRLADAETVLEAAITFFQQTGRLNKLASTTYNLALARRLSKHFADALHPAQSALHWFEQLGEAYGKAVTYALLAEIHLGLEDLAQAESYARRVLEEEHTSCLPDGLRTLGEVYVQQGKFEEAAALLRQSLAIAQENDDRILEAYALRALGAFHATRSEMTDAELFAEQATALFQELGLTSEVD